MEKGLIKKLLTVSFIILFGLAGFFSFTNAQEALPEGGGGFNEATTLETGSYSYDDSRIGEDESRYFSIDELKPGRLLRIQASMNSDVEAQNLYLFLYNQDREELDYINMNAQEQKSLTWLPGTEEGDHQYYLEVTTGGEYGGEEVAFSLNVSKEDYFDAGSQKDAGDKLTDALEVSTGTYQGYFAGQRAGSDYQDYYQLAVDEGEQLKVRATPSPEAGINMWLYDSNREEKIWKNSPNQGAINKYTFTSVDGGDFFVRLECAGCEHNIEQDTVSYSVELSKTEASEDTLALRKAGLSDGDIQEMKENMSEEEFEAKKNEILGTMEAEKNAQDQMPTEEEMNEQFAEAQKKAEEAKRMFGVSIAKTIWSLVKFVLYGLVGLVVVGVVVFLLIKQSKSKKKVSNLERSKDMSKGDDKKKRQHTKTSMGLDENIGGALAYVLGFLTGVLFLLLEKESEFVRFHAMQSTITFLGVLVVGLVPLVGWLLAALSPILWIFLIFKAYQGEKFKLPVIGDIAEKQAKNL